MRLDVFLQRVGCDKRLDSTKTSDDCGVCGGDGSSCQAVNGEFNEILPHKGRAQKHDDAFTIAFISETVLHVLCMQSLALLTMRYSLNDARA